MLDCARCEEFISTYIDHRLPDDDTRLMLSHCSTCDRCRSFLTSLLEMTLDRGRKSTLSVPASIDARVRSSLGDEKMDVREAWLSSMSRRRIAVPVPVATALLIIGLAAGIRLFVGTQGPAITPPAPRHTITHVMSLPTITIDDK